MNRLDSSLLAPLVLAACHIEPAKPELGTQPDLNVYISPNYTDPTPTIHHEDASVDLRNSLLAWLENKGDGTSEATEIAFSLDGEEISRHEVPALEPGQYFVAFNDQFVPWDTDPYDFEVHIDPEHETSEIYRNNNSESAWITPRGGVGCMVRAQALEYIYDDQKITPTHDDCEMGPFFDNYEHRGPFGDVRDYNPYCAVVRTAYDDGIVQGETNASDRDGDKDVREAVFRPYDCANRAEGAKMIYEAYALTAPTEHPCLDVSPEDWFYESVNAVARRADYIDSDGNCHPSTDLLRYDLEAFFRSSQ